MINNDEVYVIKKVEPNYTNKNVEDMGIIFINNIDEREWAMSKLSIKHQNAELTISELGPIKNSNWAVYVSDLDFDFVSDLWRKANFYNIALTWNNYIIEEVKSAYINPKHLIEDVEYYINYQFKRNSNGAKFVKFTDDSLSQPKTSVIMKSHR